MDTEELQYQTIDLSYVLQCYFDQENCDSLNDLLRHYSTFDSQLLDRIQFVIVDDGSPVPVTIDPDIDLNILLLRVREDKQWNQGGARNLGVLYARSNKVLATDLDHVFTEATFAHIVEMPRLGKKIYRFRRRDKDGHLKKPHPNTFLFSRGRFFEFYGIDEEFCGHYGSEDGMFWRWQRYNGTWFRFFPEKFASQERETDRRRSCHSLVRDTTRNHALKNRKKGEWEVWGARGGHSRQFLRFEWDIIEDRQRREITWVPPTDRLWKKTWLWRLLFG